MTDNNENATAAAARRDLAWMNAALFTDGGFEFGPGHWSALPRSGRVARLVPRRARIGAGAFAKVHDAMSRRRLIMGRATQLAIRGGAGRALPRPVGLDAALGIGGDPVDSLLARLGRAVPLARDLAVTLGPRRHNRKPVVQLLAADGTTLAYAKVATDATTAALITNELDWLNRVGRDGVRDGGVLRTPAVITELEWQARPVAVLASIDATGFRRDALNTGRVEALIGEIAELSGGRRHCTVADAIDDWSPPRRDRDGDLRRAVIAEFGDRRVVVGSWHGDLTPWNTISKPRSTAVLDWEFAARAMPVGADLVHHRVMVATHLQGHAELAALAKGRVDSPAVFRRYAAGQPIDGEAAWAMYLLRVAERDEAIGWAARAELSRYRQP